MVCFQQEVEGDMATEVTKPGRHPWCAIIHHAQEGRLREGDIKLNGVDTRLCVSPLFVFAILGTAAKSILSIPNVGG